MYLLPPVRHPSIARRAEGTRVIYTGVSGADPGGGHQAMLPPPQTIRKKVFRDTYFLFETLSFFVS